jgi:hypothetical protein
MKVMAEISHQFKLAYVLALTEQEFEMIHKIMCGMDLTQEETKLRDILFSELDDELSKTKSEIQEKENKK